jgi:hypothetical protein
LLEIYKKNTTKKLQKLLKAESQKKEIEEENDRLQKKLDAANQILSSITSNSDGSGVTIEEQLQ